MGGKAYCVFHQPGLFTIDINGQMDGQVRLEWSWAICLLQDTGRVPGGGKYSGPPIHTLTVFANPPIKDPPEPWGEGVLLVEPGQEVLLVPTTPLLLGAHRRTLVHPLFSTRHT